MLHWFVTLSAAVLCLAAPALATTHHRSIDSKHLPKTPKANAKVSIGKVKGKAKKEMTAQASTGAKGKIKSVSLGGKRHSKVHKVKGKSRKSKRVRTALAPSLRDGRTVVVGLFDEEESDLLPVAQQQPSMAFVIQVAGHTFVFFVPSNLVDPSVADKPDPGDPPASDEDGSDDKTASPPAATLPDLWLRLPGQDRVVRLPSDAMTAERRFVVRRV